MESLTPLPQNADVASRGTAGPSEAGRSVEAAAVAAAGTSPLSPVAGRAILHEDLGQRQLHLREGETKAGNCQRTPFCSCDTLLPFPGGFLPLVCLRVIL